MTVEHATKQHGNKAKAKSKEDDATEPAARRHGFAPGEAPRPAELDGQVMTDTIEAIEWVLRDHSLAKLGQTAPAYQVPVIQLHAAMSRGVWDGKVMTPEERLAMFERARAAIKPLLDMYASTGENQSWEVTNVIADRLVDAEARLQAGKATARVASAQVSTDDKEVIEPGKDPMADLHFLQKETPALRKTIGKAVEKIRDLKEAQLKQLEKAAEEVHELHGSTVLQKLDAAVAVFDIIDGLKTLTGEELQKELQHMSGVLEGVKTISELTASVVKVTGGVTVLLLGLTGVLAKATGDAAGAAKAFSLMGRASTKFANVVSVFEIAKGAAQFFDSEATAEQRYEGARGVVEGAASIAGAEFALPVMYGFALADWAASMFGQTLDAVVGHDYAVVCGHLSDVASQLASSRRELVVVSLLLAHETDSQQRKALEHQQARAQTTLVNHVEWAVDEMRSASTTIRALQAPFAPVLSGVFGSTKSPEGAARAARICIETIKGVFDHLQDYFVISTGRRVDKPKEAKESTTEAGGSDDEPARPVII